MKNIIVGILFLSALFLGIMATRPINLSDRLLIEDKEKYNEHLKSQNVDLDLYIFEKKIISDRDLTFIKSFDKDVFIPTSNSVGNSYIPYYHYDYDSKGVYDVSANLFKDHFGNYNILMTITRPYEFYKNTTPSVYQDTIDFNHAYYYNIAYTEGSQYLIFENQEYLYKNINRAYDPVIIPRNDYAQYFKHPDIVFSYLIVLGKNENIDSDFIEFTIDIFEHEITTDSIMLGFNSFVSSDDTQTIIPLRISVVYKEEEN